MPIFQNATEIQTLDEKVPGETPKAGKAYMVWLPDLERLYGPVAVASTDKSGNVTRINFDAREAYGPTRRLIIRKDLETTTKEDFTPSDYKMPRVCGADAIFVPIEAEMHYAHNGPETAGNVVGCDPQPPANFVPLTMARLGDAMMSTKKASIAIGRETDGAWISYNGRRRAEGLSNPAN